MVEDEYLKILIFGPPFNNFSGGGITLTNLFKGWPKEKIAVASTGHVLFHVATDVCFTYYLLGNKERRWIFPFNLIQRSFPSGLMSLNGQENIKQIPSGSDLSQSIYLTNVRKFLVDKLFYPFIQWLGLTHCLSNIFLSEPFKDWISLYQPEILYIQVSSREDILFALELYDYLRIPTIIHMMDDWPSTISKYGMFKNYWRKKIDREFRELLNHMDLFLSISDAMTSEYLKRYNKVFKAFHNPIETEAWLPYCKTNFRLNTDHVKILYSGRIGIGITESLVEVADVIETINHTWGKIKLYIQSPSSDIEIRSKLKKYDCIVFNPVAEYSQLPAIFSQADILLIANDFDKKGVDYLKYSMPTKVSEYMISGTPVLIYASSITAVSRFFTENECGCCVTEQDPEMLINAIKSLISAEDYRIKLSHKAVSLAMERFDTNKVRKEFHQLLINIAK